MNPFLSCQFYEKKHQSSLELQQLLNYLSENSTLTPNDSLIVQPDQAIPLVQRDLFALYDLLLHRKPQVILEFGVGKSTALFSYGLKQIRNSIITTTTCDNNMCYSVDNYHQWIEHTSQYIKDLGLTEFSCIIYSEVRMVEYLGQYASYYTKLPNIIPDLIYLDGPSHDAPSNSINGFSTSAGSGIPMSCDILYLEPFLLPGTLIVVDGRAANTRFLLNNFRRCWSYFYDDNLDQHYIELLEEPLGSINASRIKSSLGNKYFERLSLFTSSSKLYK